MRTTRALLAGLAALAVAGCASPVRLGPAADPGRTRSLLAEAAAAGPVRLELNALPATEGGTLDRRAIAAAAARGARGLAVRFAEPPAATGPARLLLVFDPPQGLSASAVCNAPALPAPARAGGPTRLLAVFCDGGGYVADATAEATGRSPEEIERLVWRTTARLFPDDYAETYGFDLFGNRVGIRGSLGL